MNEEPPSIVDSGAGAGAPGRLLLAGLAAGLAVNVGGMVSAWLLGLGESFARSGVAPEPASVGLHLALRFGVGFALAYLYGVTAEARGRGAGAVVRVAATVWMIGYLPPIAVLREIGFLTSAQAYGSAAWGLLETMLAASVAASLYRE